MDRLFLDANVLFSAAYREDAGVGRLWRLSDAVLLTSPYVVEEARRNLREASQVERLESLLDAVTVVAAGIPPPERRGGVRLPDKDWPILGGALEAAATHLSTGDVRHFGPYFGERLFGILVVTPGEYLRDLDSS